jgi:hypothetical protein
MASGKRRRLEEAKAGKATLRACAEETIQSLHVFEGPNPKPFFVWFSKSSGQRRKAALNLFFSRVANWERNKIPRNLLIIVPGNYSAYVGRLPNMTEWLMTLPYQLESLPQGQVDSIVAHEFAHLILEGDSIRTRDIMNAIEPQAERECEITAYIRHWGYTDCPHCGGCPDHGFSDEVSVSPDSQEQAA